MQNDLSQFLAALVSANLARVLQVDAPPVSEQQPAQPMTREERNRLVMSLLEQLTPLVRKYAAAYHLDFEDMYQEASIAIMRRLDAGIDGVYNLSGFMGMVVKREMIDKLRYARRRQHISLDAPTSQDDDSFTLADLLPSSSTAMHPEAALIAQEDIEEALLWVPDFQAPNTRRALQWLGETAAASLVGGAV